MHGRFVWRILLLVAVAAVSGPSLQTGTDESSTQEDTQASAALTRLHDGTSQTSTSTAGGKNTEGSEEHVYAHRDASGDQQHEWEPKDLRSDWVDNPISSRSGARTGTSVLWGTQGELWGGPGSRIPDFSRCGYRVRLSP